MLRKPVHVEPLSTDMINMAHIRVAGIGGFGLVVMAFGVALYLPAIGLSMAVAFFLGTIFAIVLIRRRRVQGPMTSSGQRPGANVVLSIDQPDAPTADRPDDQRDARLIERGVEVARP
jgi:hypothetical protein